MKVSLKSSILHYRLHVLKMWNVRSKGNAPSLALLGETYPDEQVNTWIIAQLMDLYKFAGVKEKPTFQQVLELSVMIRVEYYYLKASELLLFFLQVENWRIWHLLRCCGSYGDHVCSN